VIKDVFVWWLTAQAFGLAGLPLTRFVFRALPDRGYAFGKTLGLLLTGYLAWLIAMLGLAPFGRALLIVCALIVGGIGLFFIRDQRPKTKDQRGDRASEASSPRSQVPSPKSQTSSLDGLKLVLGYELIFALALIFLVLLRMRDYQVIINPNPWGTERPMDYALFNAIRRSASFPPHDPWLSGYSINYYYFGYLLMAAVSLVSGIGWGAAYNLSLALTFALTALGVAGIVANLIALTTNHQRSNVQTFERSNVQTNETQNSKLRPGAAARGPGARAPASQRRRIAPAPTARLQRPPRPHHPSAHRTVACTVANVRPAGRTFATVQ